MTLRRDVPRYYFHLIDDVDARDEEGQQLRDLDAARERARRLAVFTAAETVRDSQHLVRSHRIQIEDANGTVLDTVHFGDVVTVKD